jgi:hypothetical protein
MAAPATPAVLRAFHSRHGTSIRATRARHRGGPSARAGTRPAGPCGPAERGGRARRAGPAGTSDLPGVVERGDGGTGPGPGGQRRSAPNRPTPAASTRDRRSERSGTGKATGADAGGQGGACRSGRARCWSGGVGASSGTGRVRVWRARPGGTGRAGGQGGAGRGNGSRRGRGGRCRCRWAALVRPGVALTGRWRAVDGTVAGGARRWGGAAGGVGGKGAGLGGQGGAGPVGGAGRTGHSAGGIGRGVGRAGGCSEWDGGGSGCGGPGRAGMGLGLGAGWPGWGAAWGSAWGRGGGWWGHGTGCPAVVHTRAWLRWASRWPAGAARRHRPSGRPC